jgi:hypothetical protein
MIRNKLKILIINYSYDSTKLDDFITIFNQKNQSIESVVLTKTLNFDIASTKFYRIDKFDESIPKEITAFSYKEVYIINNRQVPLENTILHEIFNKNIEQIFFINKEMKREFYEPYKNIHSQSISVFPGPMVPLNLGSHQRAFNLINYLNKNGIYIDILITGNLKEFNRYSKILKAIAPNVYLYKNTKRKFSKKIRLQKFFERVIRKFLGYTDEVQDLFSERDFRKPTVSLKRTLEKLVREKKYKSIFINYAWLIKSIDNIESLNKVNLICDTHDIQFIRNKTQNETTLRLFINKQKEKRIEINNLNRMNHIIAISSADYSYLQNTILRNKVVLAPTGFNYSFIPVVKRAAQSTLNFGFIGTGMLANIESLKYIVNYWWKDILKFSPNSKLYIAGSICNKSEIKDLIFLDRSIELLGFVDSTKEFYKSIDIALNPVIIAGGLNFKSIEPLVAGKHLITNKLGAKSLKKINNFPIFESVDSIIKFLIRIEIDREYDFQFRQELQSSTLLIFNDNKAYTNIVQILKNV